MRKSSNSAEQVEYIQFTPTQKQREAKVRLDRARRDNPLLDVSRLTGAELVRITDTPKIETWRSTPGFMEWLTDTSEAAVKLECLMYKSLETLEEILEDDNPKSAAARVNAIKTIFSLASHLMPKKTEDETDQISKLSEDELRKLIECKIK